MFRVGLATAVAVALLAMPVVASGSSGWEWPVGSTVSLRYGETYVNAVGVTCSHGGVDIPAEGGSPIRACGAGTVAFSGLVPAGEGQRAYAVTVLTSDGLKVTYLPLERSVVRAGAEVSAGQELGALAAQGDGSTASSHLHLGVKRGGRQIDPLALLGAGEPSEAPKAPAEPESAPTASPFVPGHGADAPMPVGTSLAAPIAARAAAPAEPVPAVGQSAHDAGALARAAHAAARDAAAALGSRSAPVLPRVASAMRFKADAAAAELAAVRIAAVALIGRFMCAALAALCLRSVVAAMRRTAGAGTAALPVTIARTEG